MSEDSKAAPVKKKGRSKLVILIVAGLLLFGGGGVGAYFWMSRNGSAPVAEHKPEEPAGKAVALPTFTVNLADKDASRYLRTTMALVIANEKTAEELADPEHAAHNVKLMKARSAILELLSTHTAEQVTSPEGKETLKKSIAQLSSKAFGTKVTDVLFSEFVVQF